MAVEDALGVALALYRQPALVVDWRDRALPPDIELLLRVACREQAALQQARQRSGMSEDEAVEAAVFGVQQLLFGPRADAYRVLGGSIDSTQSQLRQHYRWLIKWLHPDRHDDGWEPVYADRVNLAWQALKTPERRARYDAEQGYESRLREDFGGFAGDNEVETEAPSVTTSPSGDTAIPVVHQRRASHGAVSSPAATPVVRRGRWLPAVGAVAAMLLLGWVFWPSGDMREHPADAATAVAPDLRVSRQIPGDDRDDEVADLLPEPDGLASRQPEQQQDGERLVAPVAPPPTTGSAVVSAESVTLESDAATPGADTTLSVSPEDRSALTAEPSTRAEVQTGSLAAASAINSDRPNAEPATEASGLPNARDLARTTPDDRAAVNASTQAAPVNAVNSQPRVAAAASIANTDASPLQPPAAAPSARSGSTTTSESTSVTSVRTPAVAPRDSVAVKRPETSRLPAPATRIDAQSAQHVATGSSTAPPAVPTAPAAPDPGTAAPVTSTAMVQPLPAAAPPVVVVKVEPPVATALVKRFAAAYSAGDGSQFDEVLADGLQGPVLEQMRTRIASASMRYLEVGEMQWLDGAANLQAQASVRETFVPQGGKRAETRVGQMRWAFQLENGQPKIAGLEFRAN